LCLPFLKEFKEIISRDHQSIKKTFSRKEMNVLFLTYERYDSQRKEEKQFPVELGSVTDLHRLCGSGTLMLILYSTVHGFKKL
jgi:hypothetical protein